MHNILIWMPQVENFKLFLSVEQFCENQMLHVRCHQTKPSQTKWENYRSRIKFSWSEENKCIVFEFFSIKHKIRYKIKTCNTTKIIRQFHSLNYFAQFRTNRLYPELGIGIINPRLDSSEHEITFLLSTTSSGKVLCKWHFGQVCLLSHP